MTIVKIGLIKIFLIKIIDNGKDYLIEMYVEKKEDLDVTQPKPHAKPVIGYRPKGVTLADFMPKSGATFMRQPR